MNDILTRLLEGGWEIEHIREESNPASFGASGLILTARKSNGVLRIPFLMDDGNREKTKLLRLSDISDLFLPRLVFTSGMVTMRFSPGAQEKLSRPMIESILYPELNPSAKFHVQIEDGMNRIGTTILESFHVKWTPSRRRSFFLYPKEKTIITEVFDDAYDPDTFTLQADKFVEQAIENNLSGFMNLKQHQVVMNGWNLSHMTSHWKNPTLITFHFARAGASLRVQVSFNQKLDLPVDDLQYPPMKRVFIESFKSLIEGTHFGSVTFFDSRKTIFMTLYMDMNRYFDNSHMTRNYLLGPEDDINWLIFNVCFFGSTPSDQIFLSGSLSRTDNGWKCVVKNDPKFKPIIEQCFAGVNQDPDMELMRELMLVV